MLNHLLDWLGLDLVEVPAREVMTFRADVEWFEEDLFKGPVPVEQWQQAMLYNWGFTGDFNQVELWKSWSR